MAQRQVLKWIEKRETLLEKHAPKAPVTPMQVLLGIAAENPVRAGSGMTGLQLLLEPWAVQAALDRRRGRHRDAAYEAVLGQKVTIRESGIDREVTAAEAFMLQLAKRGLEGDGTAARSAMQAIETARQARGPGTSEGISIITFSFVRPGGVTCGLEPLRMVRKLDPYRPTARIALEPWLVEAALARLGDKRLTPAEQIIILDATRTPQKVRWPEWWTELPEGNGE